MSSIGPYLRERREARGVSLKEMARSTRVRERYLEALEAETFAELPAVVFTRGFIRAYCQILKEPCEEALRLYSEQIGAPIPTGESARIVGPLERDGRGREPILISLVLLVILGVALFGLTFALQGRSRQAVSASDRRNAARSNGSGEPLAPLPVAPAPSAPQSIPAPVRPVAPQRTVGVAGTAPYRLVARVKETTWLRVRTEDGRVTEETMSPGDVREWVSNRRFVLTIGNAGGLALELNGQSLPPLGPSGAVIPQLVIPPDRP
ncbi:MAG: hypothetical protein DMD82_05915 [Candidatus Rokuibacteriota bacterium]|nr:MAG: hypothetical protein DMD82_05915 [Candidatus Rokubacteria bacterium]